MPHAWPWRGRWLALPSAWLHSHWRRRVRLARIVIDGGLVDWASAARHADAHDQAFLASLRRLAELRGDPAPAPPISDNAWRVPIGAVTAVALVQIVCACAVGAAALIEAPPTIALGRPLAVATAFLISCLVLGPAALRDSRALLLLMLFAVAGCAFAQPVLTALDQRHEGALRLVYRGVHPDIFAAAALWQFALVFPRLRHPAPIERLAWRGTCVVWVVALALFVLNLLLAHAAGAELLRTLSRNDPGYLFWRLFSALTIPALIVILLRARRAERFERRKVVRFAAALACGVGPLLVVGALRNVPAVDLWIRHSVSRAWLDPLILVPLALLPVMTSVAVLADTPFVAPGASVRTRARLPGRQRRLMSISRWLMAGRLRDQLPRALDQIRRARGSRELALILERELHASLRGAPVTLLQPEDLPRGTALLPLMDEAGLPLVIALHREPFVWLPRTDREWLDERDVRIAGVIRRRDGTIAAVAVIGPAVGRRELDRTARWYVHTLLLGASAAWPTDGPQDEPEPAFECVRCGALFEERTTCCSSSALVLAALPRLLAGHYRVRRRIGSGGMGVVYLARDETLGREVALKTLPGLHATGVRRLRDEARVMAAANHPNVATIYGLEFWQGTPVLSVEYCASTLADRLARGRLDPYEAIALGVHLCDALAYLHGRGVIHRDIKPSNVGISEDGTVKLLDFGITLLPEPHAGTGSYLAPEAFTGADPSPAFDLWALGLVLRQAAEDAPDALQAIIARATATDPADRFQSAAEMRAALASLSGPDPV